MSFMLPVIDFSKIMNMRFYQVHVLRFKVLVNNFSVKLGRSHWVLTSTLCPTWGSNPGPHDSESDALPPGHVLPLVISETACHTNDPRLALMSWTFVCEH